MTSEIALPGATDDAELGADVGRWLRAWPWRQLADASGWRWPEAASDRDLAHTLAGLSQDWDFRGRAAAAAGTNFVERSSMPEPTTDIVLGGRRVDGNQVIDAARALQLVDSKVDPGVDPTHVVVLSGTARANVNRARFAATVLGEMSHQPETIVGLTAHRELGDPERASCPELGLDATDTEWTTLRDAVIVAFGLTGRPTVRETGSEVGSRVDRFLRSATYRWSCAPVPVELVVVPAPSARACNYRPATTEDQLRHWVRSIANLTDNKTILLVTTQIYVPYQHLVATKVLRESVPGCGLRTIGVSARTATVPTRSFGPRDYLQELRSALLSTSALLDDIAGVDR